MTIYLVIALPVALWIALRLALPAGPYEMDHGQGTKPGAFFPLLILYSLGFSSVALLIAGVVLLALEVGR
jgi:hypothetical protein